VTSLPKIQSPPADLESVVLEKAEERLHKLELNEKALLLPPLGGAFGKEPTGASRSGPTEE